MRRTTMRNERGGTLAITAVVLVGVLAVMALAVDLGMLYKTRAEAQRAADAAALSGASAFKELGPTFPGIEDSARARAREYAQRNYMTGGLIQVAEVESVAVEPAFERVGVWVRRSAVQTLFARVFGMNSRAVGAYAVARALNAGSSRCIKPFALADYWDEATQDANNNEIPDVLLGRGNRTGEQWDYNTTQGDRYVQNGQGASATGLGSNWRNSTNNGGALTPQAARDPVTGLEYVNDAGRPINVKYGDPQNAYAPGYFSPWRPPGSQGGNDYRANIATCNTTEIDRTESVDYQRETGNMIGPTSQGIQDLLASDPLDLEWVEDLDRDGVVEEVANGGGRDYGARSRTDGRVYSPLELIAMNNPRVGVVPLMNPSYAMGSGGGPGNPLRFNQFRFMFFEGCFNDRGQQQNRCGNNDIVRTRFLTPAVSGTGPGSGGPVNGPELKYIRLIQ